MKKFLEKVEEQNFSTREYVLIGGLLLLGGLLLGGLFSPKGQRVFGSNNGNNNTGYYNDDFDDDEE